MYEMMMITTKTKTIVAPQNELVTIKSYAKILYQFCSSAKENRFDQTSKD